MERKNEHYYDMDTQKLYEAEYYSAIIDDDFCSNAHCLAQLSIAIDLHKPTFIIKHKNYIIPDEIQEQLNKLEIVHTFNTEEEMYDYNSMRRIMKDIEPEMEKLASKRERERNE